MNEGTGMLFLRMVSAAVLAMVKEIWFGLHFVYGCVEGTTRGLGLIAKMRWKIRRGEIVPGSNVFSASQGDESCD